MDIIINDYTLPETFFWDRAIFFQKNYESFYVNDMHYILNEQNPMITIEGILEGTSKIDVEEKYNELINNVIYAGENLKMTYGNRTYYLSPVMPIKTIIEDFDNIIKVSLVYEVKNFKEVEW